MPFAKRLVEPQLVCRHYIPNEDGLLYEDLITINNVALSRTLRQLSDLAKHACSIFQELENDLTSTNQRVRRLHGKINLLQQTCAELDPKQEAVPVSNLDVESKLTTHFQAPWHQQRNVFYPNTRPECLVELHRHANFSLWALHRDHEQRRADSRERRVTISISALPPMPLYPSPNISKKHSNLTTFESTRSSSPTECCRLSPWSRKATPLDPDSDGVALGHRSKCPIPNIPTTLDKQTNWNRALPLPTPEERMKTNSQVINSCIIPINVTGVGFDRDASVRCSLVHSQSVLQRRRKLRRRRTVAGIPRQVQQELAFFSSADSDDSPGSREGAVIVHASADATPSTEGLNTRDSGCQTEDFLVSGAPSWRHIRAQRGQALSLSYSAGNISSLRDSTENMFAGSMTGHLRTRSLPRDPSHLLDNRRHGSDEELSPYEGEDFLSAAAEFRLSAEGGSSDPQSLSSLQYNPLPDSPERSWMERTHAVLPRKSDMGSCEISSSSDTFSSPVHCAAAGLHGPMDHKDEHQSSSGNWSGSSSTCPSQTSETLPPAASPPLTGSSHCDSELSLNAATHHTDDPLDHYHGLRSQRAGSFSSTAMDILEEAGVGTPVGSDWGYSQTEAPCPQDFSPEPNPESSLDCPSFTSMATCESSFSDKPLSEKADTVSHYSVDTEGYYTSMHFDCGLKGSKSFTYNSYAASEYSLSEVGGHMTLGRRCLSLRKKKAKPSPPQRSSSLRKISSASNLQEHSEPKISCGQQPPLCSKESRMQLALSSSSGHIEPSLSRESLQPLEPLEVWDGCSELPDLGMFSSTDAHSFKDEGVVQSDYADLWLLNDLKSNDTYRSLSNSSTATGTTVIEKNQDSSGSQTSQSGSRSTTPSLPSVEGDYKLTSPEKLAGLASPSSGYSSQSETPTSSIPSAFFPGPLSPTNRKRKPKVPERKSSLTSLSYKNGTCKKDLELPTIPPSHLDLAALQNHNKAVVYRTQILHQNKPKLPGETVTVPPKGQLYDVHPMAITPTVLHTVQLKSIFKEHEGSVDKNTLNAILTDPTMSLASAHSTCNELGSSVLSSSEATPQQSCESVFTSHELTSSCEINSQDREVSSSVESMSHSEPALEVDKVSNKSETLVLSEECPLELESFTARRLEIVEDDDLDSSSDHKLLSMDNESKSVSQCTDSEVIKEVEDPESSGVSTESSLSSKDEDFCSKDSTPSDLSVSPLSDESRPEDDSVFLSPTKSRTTEDLFAMIHRSKRKVLGRKDSTELSTRTRLSAASGSTSPCSSASSPTPTSAVSVPSVTTPPTGPHKVPGPIYRNAKKSSTSNEEFKQLLLKKGSRSESSYRMSATEILRSPITPKSPSDSLLFDSPKPHDEPVLPIQYQSTSEQPVSSPYPRSNSEGFSPKSFHSSRQGRSRIPPPASSSRYGMRRLYSAPMQAISEGETENSDSSPHDDRSS
ncbi:actin remodeling regulator NHS isoform X1 [Periophthalmus magnuspinnatus]|uniref:actin remodeling regulator NHS isoform X1 n=1 Tax=Periophthalmus magnuspinnatus TaxID=409849 RepID=UPI00145BBA8C|nr:actin remodeling regulator NHS isoform X1 [Periophthalmus magnuspinnatus]